MEKSVFASNYLRAKRFNDINLAVYRNDFQRDRDRILYSRAFRRLAGKTQVFLATDDDHIRNRLTHTLEVAQISKTISRALGLDEDLTEAIALGHDIGHTPFGHVGERMLNYIMNGCYHIREYNISMQNSVKGFKHNWQSIRVVTKLEEESLNLTDHTLWGILNHSKKQYETCSYYCNDKDKSRCNLIHEEKSCNSSGIMSLEFYENDLNDIVQHTKFDECWSVEAEVVNIADEIAQRHHDIEDGLEYNLILIDELVDEIKNSFKDCIIDEDKKRLEELKNKSKSIQLREYSAIIVNTLTSDAEISH